MSFSPSRLLVGLLLLLINTVVIASSNNCPSIKDIKRTSGEFSWTSAAPGWTGHFAYPLRAKGSSTHVTRFIEARWIQLSNLENSQGYFECDYQGSYDHEIIRFVQAGTHANTKPTDMHWSCQFNPHFPSAQCVCSASEALCVLEKVDTSAAPKPMYINPEATGTGSSPADIDSVYMDK